MYYAGLDLHQRYFTLCVLTSEGQVVQDHRRLPADLEPLQSILRDLGGPVTVTVEATLQWAWLQDRLTQAGLPVSTRSTRTGRRWSNPAVEGPHGSPSASQLLDSA